MVQQPHTDEVVVPASGSLRPSNAEVSFSIMRSESSGSAKKPASPPCRTVTEYSEINELEEENVNVLWGRTRSATQHVTSVMPSDCCQSGFHRTICLTVAV